MAMQQIIPEEGMECEGCGLDLGEFDLAYRCDECGSIQCSRCSTPEPGEILPSQLPVIETTDEPVLSTESHLANRRSATWN